MVPIPETMTVATCRAAGGPEVLVPEERPVPRPGRGEVLVAVAAAGVNRPDVMQREGRYPPPEGAPEWPGLEIAGRVIETGEGAARFAEGDAVMALVPGGGYAEYAVVHETNALAVPEGLSMIEAAALPETVFTVWHNVFERGGLTAGETFLVHGGTSGIGTIAIQIATAFGARAFATAGSEAKCAEAERLGAARCVNYRVEDFVATLGEETDGHGIDLTLDMVGGDYANRNLKLAALEGRIAQIAFVKGPKVELDLSRIMLKRLTLTGSTLRARPVAVKAGIADAVARHVGPLLADGRVRPLIDATYPLREAAEAHRRMDADHIGKVVLRVDA